MNSCKIISCYLRVRFISYSEKKLYKIGQTFLMIQTLAEHEIQLSQQIYREAILKLLWPVFMLEHHHSRVT